MASSVLEPVALKNARSLQCRVHLRWDDTAHAILKLPGDDLQSVAAAKTTSTSKTVEGFYQDIHKIRVAHMASGRDQMAPYLKDVTQSAFCANISTT